MKKRETGALLQEVATAVALVEGTAGVRHVLDVVARLEPVGVRRISRASDLPVPVVAAVCAELRKRGVIAERRPAQLTPAGRSLFGFNARVMPPVGFWAGDRGSGVDAPEMQQIAAKLTRIAEVAPRARVEIDQAHCTVSTKLRRVLFAHEAGALSGKRILLLGDDDLISVTIHYVARHYGFERSIDELIVVDVDPAVLDYCGSKLSDARFPVRFLQHDLRRPLPSDLSRAADTVLTDPPYTQEGAELFLSRAASALSAGPGRHVFLSFGMKSPQATLRLQATIVAMGFAVRQLIRNFNEYLGAGTIGGTSHLYHLTSTNETTPLIESAHDGPLYTGHRAATRRYRCTGCGAVEEVGVNEELKTVRELKRRRCRACGGVRFRPLPRSSARSRRQLATPSD